MDSLGSRAAKALAPLSPALGAWAVGWSRTVLGTQQEKCPISGNEAALQQGLMTIRWQRPDGIGAHGCLLSRATLGLVTD